MFLLFPVSLHVHRLYICTCTEIYLQYYLSFSELEKALQSSFTPESIVVALDSVVDGKEWIRNITPSLHDHLKAHQFKFQCDETGECKMFFKEWSTDPFWLPPIGLSLLPAGIYKDHTCTHTCMCIIFSLRESNPHWNSKGVKAIF